MTRINIVIAAGLALAVTLSAVSAQAQSPRTFVSAAGNDSNPCSFAAPCRHFQAAVNATSAGGEVDALDPAGYGPITISQAITIEGQGWSYIAPPAGGNGITINAGSGNVAIHGVSLNGAGITGPTNGIVLNSAGSLTVTNCTLQNFVFDGSHQTTGNGILMQPTGGTLAFTITNTTASNNGDAGIFFNPPSGAPSANGAIDHVVANANQFGIFVRPVFATGGSIVVTVSDSIVSNNSSIGIFAGQGSATPKVSIDNVTVSSNVFGIEAENPANVLLGRAVITGNTIGVQNSTSPNTFYTYQNNQIDLNGTDVGGTALNATKVLR
jgi:hypothetical protein